MNIIRAGAEEQQATCHENFVSNGYFIRLTKNGMSTFPAIICLGDKVTEQFSLPILNRLFISREKWPEPIKLWWFEKNWGAEKAPTVEQVFSNIVMPGAAKAGCTSRAAQNPITLYDVKEASEADLPTQTASEPDRSPYLKGHGFKARALFS